MQGLIVIVPRVALAAEDKAPPSLADPGLKAMHPLRGCSAGGAMFLGRSRGAAIPRVALAALS
jgi:hypothetical protein